MPPDEGLGSGSRPFEERVEMSIVLLFTSALAAALYGTVWLTAARTPLRAVTKTAAVASLAVYAFLAGGPLWLVAALVLSALGDFFLAFDGEKPFLAGLTSFLLAHVVYIVLFRSVGMPLVSIGAEPGRLAGAVAIVAFCLALLVWLWGHLGDMRLPVLAYTATIATMVVSATALDGRASAVVGAFAFALSDACLATVTFRLKEGRLAEVWLPLAVWWLYWGAQVAITAGFVAMGWTG
jgi:uncharacterized membrane protein YhhN